ncbi:MAG: nuclear transport factor 2 family protein [Desulfobacterales bacterium]|nr:MAG: nuclear transport factor 2 family protein [Desulfobacterales bacterium]
MMSNEQIVQIFFEVFNNRDMDKMGNLLNSDAEFFFPKTQPLIGRERILKFLKILFRQYPELSFTIQRVIQQGDQAAVHWTNHGLNRREEPYENEGVTILEMQNGKISYISDFFKNTDFSK